MTLVLFFYFIVVCAHCFDRPQEGGEGDGDCSLAMGSRSPCELSLINQLLKLLFEAAFGPCVSFGENTFSMFVFVSTG